ncbi:M3 family oligoendopeptidase [Gorillibacterium sp. CAU 1737]|uniref:M3 family oligoendopeptidase n=1 Tax=Gorillibacterium sp. CAU 1737 TaxID=3140362 RepID=UPI0032606EF8
MYLKLFSYSELCFSLDSSNEEAMNRMDELEALSSSAQEAQAHFKKWLAEFSEHELERVAGADAYLAQHAFYLRELREQAQHVLSEEAEAILGKLQQSGSKAWEKLYMRTVSTLRIEAEWGGESRSLSLSDIRGLAYDPDPEVRRAAYEAEQEACRTIAEQSAACLNALCGEAAAIYERRGYSSPLHKVLSVSRMDQKTLDVMMRTIQESLPMFRSYYKKKAELLGYPGKLPFHEVYAPISGEAVEAIAYEKAAEIIEAGFRSFHSELGDFARKAFRQRWIDAEPRSGKGAFGMCVDIFPIEESRIITSFTGHSVDVSILAHELGHAYHSSRLTGQTMVNTNYPIPIAETASIFCETLINEEMLRTSTSGEAVALLERSLSDAAYYIVDFYARYLFETRLYEARKSGALSVEAINELMKDAMDAAYGDSVVPGSIHPYQWISKPGYYMAGNEYLNFPYSFGLLFSKGLFARYKKQGEAFVGQYQDFLSATSTHSVAEAARLMNIDVHSSEFWQDALRLIAGEIERFSELS